MTESSFKPGDVASGFTVRSCDPLPELNATLIQLEHPSTGARWAHIDCEDDNNLFAVTFRTPPDDSTGIAHILEHTVLCGSELYPVRDPFFAMLKRSLSTFMNAMTAGDWTSYPFATRNRKDFDNLLGIYLDATFFPLLRRRDFLQEGHRLDFVEPQNPESPLQFKGVVYNEMKGAMASPSSFLYRRLTRLLYPSTCYRFNSGGEPENIPDLTWEDLRRFHRQYYHPGNAWFFSYGNIPLADHLQRVDTAVMQKLPARQVDSQVPQEKPLTAPLQVSEPYPIDAGEATTAKSMVQLAWLTCAIDDSYERLVLTLLSSLLLGNSGAPLYRALIESRLGGGIAPGSGYQDENRSTYFAIGLQGTEADRTDAIAELIDKTLRDVATTGFSRERIDGVIHRLEFAHREVNGDRNPYALNLLMRMIGPWLHSADPLTPLRIDAHLKRLRSELEQGDFFESRIRRWLLDNPHRVTLTLVPDPDLPKRQEAAISARLTDIASRLDSKKRSEIIADAAALQQSQEEHENLSCLPTLQVSDIPTQELATNSRTESVAGEPVELFAQPTNGISYITAHMPINTLDETQLKLLPIWCSVITQMGAAGHSYITMAERMEAHTGGVHFAVEILDHPVDPNRFEPLVSIRGKALRHKQDELFALLSDYCTAPDFSDIERLRNVLKQLQVSFENAIPGNGHLYALRAGCAHLSAASQLREHLYGFSLLKRIRTLVASSDADLRKTAEALQQVGLQLTGRGRLRCSITAEEADFATALSALESFLQHLPMAGACHAFMTPPFCPQPAALGWAGSVPVSYVTRAFATVPYTHADSAPLMVLARLLRAEYLHREIREKGGAYGGQSSYDSEAGIFALLSYRDPHLTRTLKVYDDAIAWAVRGEFNADALREALLSTFSAIDRPLAPGSRGGREFSNQRQGLTLQMRQQLRDRLLAVKAEDLQRVAAQYLRDGMGQSVVSVVSSDELLQKANTTLGENKLTIARI
jgi:Zn-dependent M16 (insulinase) family peptidase